MPPRSTSQMNALSQNMANSGLANTFTPTFGNMSFQIQPSMTGEVSNTFGTIPYLALESLIYSQATGAQISPTSVLAGQNSGQQNIQGTYTIQDTNGLPRMVMGYSPGGF